VFQTELRTGDFKVIKKTVDTLILDLDNTIFDWFAVWHASFKPVYDEIVRLSGRDENTVQADIRAVHQKQRTSEYTFLIEDVTSLTETRKSGDIRQIMSDVIETSKRARDQALKLYPNVFRSLWALKANGTKIVAYTESMGFYSAYRLKRFGLDGVIDIMFCPADHDTPAGVSVDKVRSLPDEFYELQVTEVRHTPPGELKPNPAVLLDIIRSVGANVDRCAYVGDSLFKDMAMARDVGAFDIHAKYGEVQQKDEYNLLRKVSHWTDADVKREKDIASKVQPFHPSAVLSESFGEIFMHCDFEPFTPPILDDDKENVKNTIDIWKKVVDVQQHFNDLEMRVRNYGITIVAALIAACGFTYKEELVVTILGRHFPAAIGLVAAAIFAWIAFYLMDKCWYHVLLKGTVKHAEKIEKALRTRLPAIALGLSISEASGDSRILGLKMNSEWRLRIFYLLGLLMLVVILITLAFSSSHAPDSVTSISSQAQASSTSFSSVAASTVDTESEISH